MSREHLVEFVRTAEAEYRQANRYLAKVRHSDPDARTEAARAEEEAYAAYRTAVRVLREDAQTVYGVSFAELAAMSRTFNDETR